MGTRQSVYAYNDSSALTRELLAWLVKPAALECDDLNISANCSLEEEACAALVHSDAAKTIENLEFVEIYFSAEQLAQILMLPNLTSLTIRGGESYDWAGSSYIYSTLGDAHLQVLLTDSNAQKLRSLDLHNQQLSDEIAHQLYEAIPNLRSVML